MPSNRGMVLQQHFQIGIFDQQDIRYKVTTDPQGLSITNRVRPIAPEAMSASKLTDKGNIPNERELRGLTGTWENTMYLIPFFFILHTIIDLTSRII